MQRRNIRERDKGFITPDGIKRIVRDRDLRASELAARTEYTEHAKRRHVDASCTDGCIIALVLSKNGVLDNLDKEVLYVARYLAEEYKNHSVIALVCGETSADLGAMGADTSIGIDYDITRDHNPDELAKLISNILTQSQAKHLIGAESDWGDSDILRRVALHNNCTFTPSVIAIEPSKHDIATQYSSHKVQQENALVHYIDQHYEAVSPLTTIFAIGGTLHEGTLHNAWEINKQETHILKDSNRLPMTSLPPSHIALTEATFICAAGNGVHDINLFRQCAEALGAVIGASRVITDSGRLPRDRQVGATGVSVRAQVYLCFGISGAIQHLQGIRECNTVIAVNTDPSCPMISRADLAFIADAEKVMQAMLDILAKR